MAEPEPFDFDPKNGARISVILLAGGAVLWAITGKASAAGLPLALGAVTAVITVIFTAWRRD